METVLLVTLIYTGSYFIKGIAGFGDPLISGPLLSMFLENRVISPNTLLLSAPANARIAWKNRENFSLKMAIPIIIFLALGIIPGTLALKYADSWVLKTGLGILILGIGIEMLTRDRAKVTPQNKAVLAFSSFCSGITSGLYSISVFFVAYLERTSKNRSEFRGTMCFVFLAENICRIIIYAISGVFTREILMLTLMSMPGAFLGFTIGSRIDKRLSEEEVRRIVIAVFMLGGASVLIKALYGRFFA